MKNKLITLLYKGSLLKMIVLLLAGFHGMGLEAINNKTKITLSPVSVHAHPTVRINNPSNSTTFLR